MPLSFTLTDILVGDIVKNMAEELSVDYTEDFNVTRLNLPKEIGMGEVKATQFASGFGVVLAKYVLNNPFEFELHKNLIHPLKILYNLGSPFEHRRSDETEFRKILTNEYAIVASSNARNHFFRIPSGQEIFIFSIEINRKLFEHKLNDFAVQLDERLNYLLRDSNGVNSFFYKAHFEKNIKKLILEITNIEIDSFLTSLGKEIKTYETLLYTFENFLGLNSDESSNIPLSDKQLEVTEKTSKYILSHLSNLKSINDIAKLFSVSEKFLQQCFKKKYHMTINEFVQTKRLEVARKLLETTDLSLSEITYEIGLNSKSYFSKVFKDRYGINPSEYRGSRMHEINFY